MKTLAVVLEAPERLALSRVELAPPGDDDLVVDIEWSGISTGTEKLLWSGRMPAFPGMGYPLIPGYESVGRVSDAGKHANKRIGECVFVPGARCFGSIRGLFGGAAARVVVPAARTVPIDDALGEQGVLLALAATAYHAVTAPGSGLPQLIVGHGVLGRLLARLTLALGGEAPVVWEVDARRASGAAGYSVLAPDADTRRDYRFAYDVSGDPAIVDRIAARLAPRGEIVLAGFYAERVSFDFAPAFMREARIRVAAEWQPQDLVAVQALVAERRLSLAGLITHRSEVADAPTAYRTAFTNPECLKMVLDWRRLS
jgi:3-hydroxyethyl bacteriochlorophyllide a dehydrogenase